MSPEEVAASLLVFAVPELSFRNLLLAPKVPTPPSRVMLWPWIKGDWLVPAATMIPSWETSLVSPLEDITLSTAIDPKVSVMEIFPPAVAKRLKAPTSARFTRASVMVLLDPVPAERTTLRPWMA